MRAAAFGAFKSTHMKKFLYILVIPVALMCTACQPNEPKPSPDGMRHDSLTVSDTLFSSPERGFDRAVEFHCPNQYSLPIARVKATYESGFTLMHIDFFLEDYRDKLIDEAYLENVRKSMQALREGGCKCILRFAYTNNENDSPREAHEDLVLQHIAQIKPILQEYVDVIYVMEAGFVGVWGEWYYTSGEETNFKQEPSTAEDYLSRRHVLDALLDALPQERMICVRTPKFKQKCYGWKLADTLTLAEAYSGTPKARLAAHDDAIMADNTDLGTFTPETRMYWEAETKYLIYGGESCPGATGSMIGSCDKATDQFLKMHIGYLNYDYYKPTINKWQNGGCLDYFKRNIGYRFEGRDIATTEYPKAGEVLKAKLSLVNVGFSAPKNPRDIEMILINTEDPEDRYTVVPNSDPRYWFTDQMVYVEAAFQPKHAGTYKLYLNLPDPMPNLHNDPRYSIRLANENCWEEETGYNYLTTVTVE